MSETQEALCETPSVPAPELHDLLVIGEATRERITSWAASTVMTANRMRVAGVSETRAPYRVVRLTPNIGHIVVCVGGAGQALVDGVWHDFTPGMAYLTAPRQTHAFYARSLEPWKLAWVIFEEDAELPWPDDGLLVHADAEPLYDSVLGLYRESTGAADAAHLSVWAELVILQSRRLLRGGGRPDRLRTLWEQVEKDLARPWTAGDLASLACLSEGQLRVVCQQGTGRSPIEQVTFLRMRRAAALLLSADYTVEHAAYAVGYTNPFAFSTAFKRVVGVPPSRYRGS